MKWNNVVPHTTIYQIWVTKTDTCCRSALPNIARKPVSHVIIQNYFRLPQHARVASLTGRTCSNRFKFLLSDGAVAL